MVVKNVLKNTKVRSGVKDWSVLKNGVKDELRDFIYKQTKRSPVILPIFIEV